jgi:hypothetical protein
MVCLCKVSVTLSTLVQVGILVEGDTKEVFVSNWDGMSPDTFPKASVR